MNTASTVTPDTNDYQSLDRALDQAKSAAFMGKNAAFMTSILCSLNFSWDTSIKTACVDGRMNLRWNPNHFKKLSIEARKTVLIHELWHPGRLHFDRQGDRDGRMWNIACDFRINNTLQSEGYSFDELKGCCLDPSIPSDMAEEDIYDAIVAGKIYVPPSMSGGFPDPNGSGELEPGDMVPMIDEPGSSTKMDRINSVVRAVQQAKISQTAGNLPGDIEITLNRFLKPIIPWEKHLRDFMTGLTQEGTSWSKRSRRYPGNYMPGKAMVENMLANLMYFEDVSGSISDEDVVRFNSEVKYVHEYFKPDLLTLIQFDTIIQQVIEIKGTEPFERVKVVGRGGTSLVEVRNHIIKHRPTAAIIFSDLYCGMMEPLPFPLPVIWVCIRNKDAAVNFGKIIHIH